jgi:hypothetical protein
LKQVDKALLQIKTGSATNPKTQRWIKDVEHYQALTLKVVDQTVRRVIDKESVPSSEKVISLFEEHSDIIVKGYRDIQYGHKVKRTFGTGKATWKGHEGFKAYVWSSVISYNLTRMARRSFYVTEKRPESTEARNNRRIEHCLGIV